MNAWEGKPAWSADLSAAVAERLVQLKSQLLDIVVDSVLNGTRKPDKRRPEEKQAELESFLMLDEDYLRSDAFQPDEAERLRAMGSDAVTDIEELLTEEQCQEFREVGLSSLLSRTKYSWEKELLHKMNGLPADRVGKRTKDYSHLFCPKPFEHAEIGPNGRTHLCCALWLPEAVGDYDTGSFMDVWNSEKAQEVRQSILNGSFCHCIEEHCPELQNETLPRRDEVQNPEHRDIIDNNLTVLDRGPRDIVLGYDMSCNLACPSCRTHLIMTAGKEKHLSYKVQDWATAEHLKDARKMDITLSGDAFGSPVYHDFLREFDGSRYPDLRITLCTNGLLFTEKNWNGICNESVDVAYISVDAATPETYALNRGGNFELLMENLKFVGSLRARGELEKFVLSFVVQENNYSEMPAFVSIAKSINAIVMFIQIANTGTFTQDEFERRAVHLPTHPKHQHLLEVLKDPSLGLPFIALRNFEELRQVPNGIPALPLIQ